MALGIGFFIIFDFISHLNVTGLYSWAGICGVSPSHGKSLVIFEIWRSKFRAWTLPRGIKVTLEQGWELLENPGITGTGGNESLSY